MSLCFGGCRGRRGRRIPHIRDRGRVAVPVHTAGRCVEVGLADAGAARGASRCYGGERRRSQFCDASERPSLESVLRDLPLQ